MNCIEFHEIVSSPESSLEFLRAFCWSEGQVACLKCGDTNIYRIGNNRYRCPSCHYSFHDLTGRYLGEVKLGPVRSLWMVKLFSLGIPALVAAYELDISYPTALKAYDLLRAALILSASDAIFDRCKVEVDEAYFGGRKKGVRGRGAKGKVPVIGLKTRSGSLRMEILDDVSSESLIDAVKRNVPQGSTVYSDKFRGYNDLKRNGYDHHRIDHSKYFVNGSTHTNGIEGAWSFVKTRMVKFNGVSKRKFPLYLAEMEWRFNNRGKDLFRILIEESCKFVPNFF